MLIDKTGDGPLVVMRQHDAQIIEIVWHGFIGMDQLSYLERLSELLHASRRRRSLLYDLRPLTGYAHQIVGAHAGFSNVHREHLEKIAVISNLTSVRFAIHTISLWQRVPIVGVLTRETALAWLLS